MKNEDRRESKIKKVKWDATKHYPTKAELEEDLTIDTTPEKLLAAVINHNPNKKR